MIRVLLVDDDSLVRKVVVDKLRAEFKFHITEAGSGNEAIKFLEAGKRFDVIISDYYMDEGSGADLLRFIYAEKIFALFALFTGATDLRLPETNNHFLGVIEKMKIQDLMELIVMGVCMGGSPQKKKVP